jgi:hypothetical protein
VYSYRDQVRASRRARATHTHPFHPTVFVGWDNTPRRRAAAVVIVDDDADRFEDELRVHVGALDGVPHDERLVFLNAWNEWAEGNHLEPDLDTGRAKLEAVARVLGSG